MNAGRATDGTATHTRADQIVNQSAKKRVLTAFALALVVLAAASTLEAKVVRTTLDELVEQSELVMYGVTTHQEAQAERDQSIVWFKANSLLKAPKGLPGGDIPICEDSARRDTVNLREYSGAYVVFASMRGHCFSPVAGYKSLIPVNEGVARTLNIDEQPRTEPLEVFLAKIRKLLSSESKK